MTEPGVRFAILGPLEATRDGERLTLGSRQMRTVLALLVLDVGRVVSTDRLIDDLWGDEPPASASNVLQVYVSRLRGVLGADLVKTRAPGYVLDVDAESVDLVRFEKLVSQGRDALSSDRPSEAAGVLREALALWRGRVLEDVTGPRVEAEASRLEQLRLAVLEDRIDADLRTGSAADAILELERLNDEYPLRERSWALRMRALYGAGRQAEALSAYANVRTLLDTELGIEPGAELRALERAILNQEPILTPERARAADAPEAWLVIDGRPDVRLAGERVVVGRAPGSDVVLDDPLVSGTHAVLQRAGAGWTIRDLGSRNGSFVNGERVTAERVLHAEDEVRVGSTTLRYRGSALSDLTIGADGAEAFLDDDEN